MEFSLKELLDISRLRELLGSLEEVQKIPSAIIDKDGTILIATAWQDICTKFHRVHPEVEEQCQVSDRYIENKLAEPVPSAIYRCPMGLTDAAMPIIIDGAHLGNVFVGQVFSASPDEANFIDQARKYGFDQNEYLAAMHKVPVVPEDKLRKNLFFIHGMTQLLVEQGWYLKRQQEIEKDLRLSEERFRRIFDELSIGMAICDENGKFLRINQAFTEITGYSKQEMNQLTFANITSEDFHDEEARLFQELVEESTSSYQIEKQCIHKDGSLFWSSVHANRLLGSEGSPSLFIGSIINIDERKRLAIEVKQREETISLLLNSTTEGIYGVDLEGICIFCNQSAQELLGYTEEELTGENIQKLIMRDNSKFFDGKTCVVKQAIKDGKPHHYEKLVMWCSDGSWFYADYWIHPMRQNGQIVGAVVTFLDISEKVQIQEHQLRSSQLAALGELAAGVAHEINNPINGMINYAQLLLNTLNVEPREEKILKNIIKEGHRIATIVQNLLNFARKETQSMQFLTLRPMIEEPLNLIKTQLASDGISVELSISDDIPQIRVNRLHIEQVVLNLLSNSRHALNKKYVMPSDKKIIRITAKAKLKEKCKFVQIEFFDQGSGINSEDLERIFNPFFTTKESGVGTGLGLSISQEIITKHGGFIHVDTEEGVYTSVKILLPADDDCLDQ